MTNTADDPANLREGRGTGKPATDRE